MNTVKELPRDPLSDRDNGSLRVGVIGAAGLMAQAVYLPLLSQAESVSTEILYDRDMEAAVAVAENVQAAHVACSLTEILTADIDAVMVLTPPWTHCEIVRAALEADKHVFVEKPLALDPAEARELNRLAKEVERRLVVGYMKRFEPLVKTFKSMVRDLGPIQRATMKVVAGSWGAAEARARIVKSSPSSLDRSHIPTFHSDESFVLYFRLASQFVHDIDLVMELLGAPTAIVGATFERYERAVDMRATLRIGALPVELHFISPADPDTPWTEELTVISDSRAATLSLPPPLKPSEAALITVTDQAGPSTRTEHRSGLGPFREQLEHFIACVGHRDMEDGSAASGINHLDLAAALTAVSVGRTVEELSRETDGDGKSRSAEEKPI